MSSVGWIRRPCRGMVLVAANRVKAELNRWVEYSYTVDPMPMLVKVKQQQRVLWIIQFLCCVWTVERRFPLRQIETSNVESALTG